MSKPPELSETELRDLRKWFEPMQENINYTPFDRLCNGLLKTGQLFIDKIIIEKANARGRGW